MVYGLIQLPINAKILRQKIDGAESNDVKLSKSVRISKNYRNLNYQLRENSDLTSNILF